MVILIWPVLHFNKVQVSERCGRELREIVGRIREVIIFHGSVSLRNGNHCAVGAGVVENGVDVLLLFVRQWAD